METYCILSVKDLQKIERFNDSFESKLFAEHLIQDKKSYDNNESVIM